MKSNVTVKGILIQALDALAPMHCCICSDHIASQSIIHRICDSCYFLFSPAPTRDVILNSLFRKKKESSIYYADSAFEFHHAGSIQIALHEMKYRFGKQMAFDFGKEMGKNIMIPEIDIITPIPLHHARKRERGFNQSLEIAKGYAMPTSLKVHDCIKRLHYTTTQTKLTIEDRKHNVSNAFALKDNINIRNKHVLLIDDVLTTGATLESCAELLLEHGARRVSALTIATARLN
jgi:ComF family protein